MRNVKMKGKTVEEAVDAALQVLGAKKEDVQIKVLSEGGGGVLGIGAKDAEVEVTEVGNLNDHAKNLLQDILDKMDFVTIASPAEKSEEGYIKLEIKGEDMGRIIGKEGATIDALQYLISIMLSKRKGERVRVIVDAEGYREKRQKKMESVAQEVAAEVEGSGKEVKLEQMSAADRRAIHMALKDNPKVMSYSIGEGSERRIIIAPKS